MNYNFIYRKILEVYKKCRIDSFPINCKDILKSYKHTICPYSFLESKNKELLDVCLEYSEDAFRFKNMIYYNDSQPKARINFSLMHELGHIILDHHGEYDWQEVEANAFASHILAPRIVIHFSRCESPNDVQKAFGLSSEASEYAYNSYLDWLDNLDKRGNILSDIDREIYNHFYNNRNETFVWKKRRCRRCGKTVINKNTCRCFTDRLHRYSFYCNDAYSVPGFAVAEYKYLYGHDL